MPDLDMIHEQVSQLDGGSKWLASKEIKSLPSLLEADEHVLAVVQGMYNDANGLLVLTPQRLLFIDKKMLGRLKVEEFHLRSISSVEYKIGVMMGEVTIFASSNTCRISMIAKASVKPFVNSLNTARKPSEPTIEVNNKSDSITDLERLARLHKEGSLNDDEFSQAKTKLLA